MKQYLPFLLVLCLFYLNTAKGQSANELPAKHIPGMWETDLVGMKNAIKKMGKNSYDSLPMQVKERIEHSISTRVFVFSEEGDFEARWQLGDRKNSVKGNWGINANGKLYLELASGITEYRMNFTGNSKLVLIPERDQIGLIHELHFIKNKKE